MPGTVLFVVSLLPKELRELFSMAVSTSALTGSVAAQQQSPGQQALQSWSFLSVRVVIFSLTLACPFALLDLLSLERGSVFI